METLRVRWHRVYLRSTFGDMLQAVKTTLLLYADDSCILHQHKEVDEIKKQLNKDFEVNKLSIHFVEEKIKSILFVSKRRSQNVRQLNIRYKHVNIKQRAQVTYLEYVLDDTMSGGNKGYKQNKCEIKISL